MTEAPWRARVPSALAEFPEGATIARLCRPLADGTQDYCSAYRRIYRTLRACESSGRTRRADHARARMPFAWGKDLSALTWHGQPPGLWQVTAAGADYLQRVSVSGDIR